MPFSIDNEHPKLKSIPYDFKNYMAKHILVEHPILKSIPYISIYGETYFR